MLTDLLTKFEKTEHVKRKGLSTKMSSPKPFIQWVGGKRQMLSQYKEYFPREIERYFEPFLGAAAVFFYMLPDKAFLSDNNKELITVYEAVRDNPEDIIKLLKMLRSRHSKELYMAVRSIDREVRLMEDFEKHEIAARFIYLNQTGFNGLYRVNKKGHFNVPIGSSLNRLICDEHTIRTASKVLRKVSIKCLDFEEAVEDTEGGDFVYFDPPYYPIAKYSDFNRYTKEKFYEQDQKRLKYVFDRLTKRGVKVMLSNSSAEFIKNLYEGYRIIEVESGRNLNSKKNLRGQVKELLILNY